MPGDGTVGSSSRHQVDLRPLALEPGELAQRLRRLDPLEPEQLEEADRGLDVGGRDLDPDVVEHAKNLQRWHRYVTFCLLRLSHGGSGRGEGGAKMTEWNDGRLDESQQPG